MPVGYCTLQIFEEILNETHRLFTICFAADRWHFSYYRLLAAGCAA
jgi:hypothetical protein